MRRLDSSRSRDALARPSGARVTMIPPLSGTFVTASPGHKARCLAIANISMQMRSVGAETAERPLVQIRNHITPQIADADSRDPTINGSAFHVLRVASAADPTVALRRAVSSIDVSHPAA